MQIICASLFYGVVWLRSLLNIFTYMDHLPCEQHYKLVLRMNQLVELEAALYDHIQRCVFVFVCVCLCVCVFVGLCVCVCVRERERVSRICILF